MKVKLELPSYTFLLFDDLSEAGPLFKAIANARLCKESGYGTAMKVEQCPVTEIPKLELVPDSYDATPNDVMKELKARAEQSDVRWLEQYNKATALTKELNELKEKHEKIVAAASNL